MGRAPCCDKANVKRGPWSPEEDNILRTFIQSYGTGGNWIALPRKAGLKRCGKSCRLRWLNYLRPDIKHGGFTEEEDNIIITLFNNIGSRWSVIAAHLPKRTDNDVKNYWNTKLKKKKLSGKTDLKINNNNNNRNASSNSIIHLNSVQYFPGSSTNDEDYSYGISAGFGPDSSPVSYQTGGSYWQDYDSKGLMISTPAAVQFPLPGLMEVSDQFNTSYSISSSQEVSSLSAASSSLALDNNGGRVQEDDGDQFLIDFGSPYELLSGFCFQEQTHEASGLNLINPI